MGSLMEEAFDMIGKFTAIVTTLKNEIVELNKVLTEKEQRITQLENELSELGTSA